MGRARSLFARRGLHSAAAEKRLSTLVESPVAAFRQRLSTSSAADGNTPKVISIDDWSTYRALFLLIVLQGGRSALGLGQGPNSEPLEGILGSSDEAIDSGFSSEMRASQLLFFRAAPGLRLFFPSTGLFALPIATPSAFTVGMTVPLTPTSCVTLTVSDALPRQYWEAADLVVRSTGTSHHATRVVIPPELETRYSHGELAVFIPQLRAESLRRMKVEDEIRQIELAAFEKIGVVPPPMTPFDVPMLTARLKPEK